jgi:hypothetical protein
MIQECNASLLIEHLIAPNHLINPILPSDRWFGAGSNEVCDGKGSSFRLDPGEKFFPPISIYSGYMQFAVEHPGNIEGIRQSQNSKQ